MLYKMLVPEIYLATEAILQRDLQCDISDIRQYWVMTTFQVVITWCNVFQSLSKAGLELTRFSSWQVIVTETMHCLLFHKRSTDWDSPLGYKQVMSNYTRRISLLLTLIPDSCNNNDILLVDICSYVCMWMHVYWPRSSANWIPSSFVTSW